MSIIGVDAKAKTTSSEKFVLLVDLGIITVPENYDHGSCLRKFRKKNLKKFFYFNKNITDKNFSKPSRILKPGDKLRVRVFKQIVSDTTSEERMVFLATQKAVYPGAQGASLVWEQKREQLLKNNWYYSFDKREALWEEADGYHGVALMYHYTDGDFKFDLDYVEDDWGDDSCLLCFCEVDDETDDRFKQVDEFIVKVPKGYNHETCLTTFAKKHRHEFSHFDRWITDQNFGKATTRLVAGQKFKVRVIKINNLVSSEDCLAHLRLQKAVLVGAQGATLVYEEAKHKLPFGWHISFDKEEGLWKDTGNYHMVPIIRLLSGNISSFELGLFEFDWSGDGYLLCFCEVDESSSA